MLFKERLIRDIKDQIKDLSRRAERLENADVHSLMTFNNSLIQTAKEATQLYTVAYIEFENKIQERNK